MSYSTVFNHLMAFEWNASRGVYFCAQPFSRSVFSLSPPLSEADFMQMRTWNEEARSGDAWVRLFVAGSRWSVCCVGDGAGRWELLWSCSCTCPLVDHLSSDPEDWLTWAKPPNPGADVSWQERGGKCGGVINNIKKKKNAHQQCKLIF